MMSPATAPIWERPCPACGSRAYRAFADERLDPTKISDFTYASRKQPEFMCLRLVRCTSCDLVYAPCPPGPEFLGAAYSGAAYDSGPEAQAAAESYAKALAPFLAPLAGGGAAIDVGAGSGPLLPWLKELGFTPVLGIEPSRAAIEAAPTEVRPLLREGMFSPTLLAGVSPILICSFMTLEHLPDPGTFVQDVFNLLQPGGLLAVVVHNWRAPVNRLLGQYSPIIDVEHLQLFSPRSIQALLTNAGFVSIARQPIANRYPLRYWLRLTPLHPALKSALAGLLERQRLADFPISLRVGNMLAVGYKPSGTR